MVSKEEIPEYWEMKQLGDVIEKMKNGGTPRRSTPEYWDSGEIPWLKISDLKDKYTSESEEKITQKGLEESSAKLFEPGTILLTIYATVGRVSILEEECSANQAITGIKPNESQVTPDYLYHYLESIEDYFKSKGRGGAQDNINQTIIKEAPIPVPPLEEQKMIVEKLDEIFENIEEIQDAQEQAEELEENLKVSVIGSELEKYDNEEKIENVISRIKGGSSADQHDEPRGYPVSRIETIADAEIDPNAVNYVDIDEKEYEKHVMQEGDILFSNINSPPHVGKTAIYEGVPDDLIHGMNLVLIRADEEKILPEFLELSLTFEKNKGTFKNMCKQAVNQASLAQRDIKPIEITVPPIEDQKEIMQRISSVRGQVREIFGSHAQAEEVTEDLPKSVLSEAFKADLVDFEPEEPEEPIKESSEKVSFEVEGQTTLEDV